MINTLKVERALQATLVAEYNSAMDKAIMAVVATVAESGIAATTTSVTFDLGTSYGAGYPVAYDQAWGLLKIAVDRGYIVNQGIAGIYGVSWCVTEQGVELLEQHLPYQVAQLSKAAARSANAVRSKAA